MAEAEEYLAEKCVRGVRIHDFEIHWEDEIPRSIPSMAYELEQHARYWQQEAIKALTAYRKMDDGPEALNLGVIVRVREDTLGPRITWVKFRGKSRYRMGQDKFTPTEPIRMAGKYRYSDRTFARFPDAIRDELIFCEFQFAIIRYRTECLAQLRTLCRTVSTNYRSMFKSE